MHKLNQQGEAPPDRRERPLSSLFSSEQALRSRVEHEEGGQRRLICDDTGKRRGTPVMEYSGLALEGGYTPCTAPKSSSKPSRKGSPGGMLNGFPPHLLC